MSPTRSADPRGKLTRTLAITALVTGSRTSAQSAYWAMHLLAQVLVILLGWFRLVASAAGKRSLKVIANAFTAGFCQRRALITFVISVSCGHGPERTRLRSRSSLARTSAA